jgi:3-phosphoshikimate 1-carboxyvinyltransferase
MDFLVQPAKKTAQTQELRIPSSKSHSMRAILLASMAQGVSHLKQVLPSPDREAMVHACRSLGAQIDVLANNELMIHGVAGQPSPVSDVLDVGNSGQVLRFIGAMAALLPTYTVLTGDDSIRTQRPIEPLLHGLRGLGAWSVSALDNGCAPMIVRGPVRAGAIVVEGQDSQPVSALLMLSAFLPGVTHIQVKDPGERPWIDLTLDWLARLGVQVTHHHYQSYTVHGGMNVRGFNYQVPGDYSSAAFPLVAALLTRTDCVLSGLDPHDAQGDKKILQTLERMGAKLEWDEAAHQLHVVSAATFSGCEIDVNDTIDAVPILAVMACCAEGRTVLKGAKIARSKESDRLHAMTVELSKMGAKIQEFDDGLVIQRSDLKAATVDSHHDHRIAMALSVAALRAEGTTRIKHIDCVAKSYPDYAQQMQSLGFSIEETESVCGS